MRCIVSRPRGSGTAVVCGVAEAAQPGAGDAQAAWSNSGSGQAISASVVIQSLRWVGRCLAGSSGSTAASE